MTFAEPEWFEQVTSTNTIVLERIDAGESLPDGYVLATTEQTAGRGRGTRHWHAEAGRDLCCSILYRNDAPARQLASLAMATALGIVDALHEYGIKAQTKWPNDVLVGDAKIAGILCELRPGSAVIGIGLNVSMSAAEAATSILIETGTVQAPREVLPILLQVLSRRLQAWQEGGFAGLRSDWCRHCLALGQDITIDDGDTRQTGVLAGFGDAGQLLLQPHDLAQDGSSTPVEIWSGHLRLTNR